MDSVKQTAELRAGYEKLVQLYPMIKATGNINY